MHVGLIGFYAEAIIAFLRRVEELVGWYIQIVGSYVIQDIYTTCELQVCYAIAMHILL